MLAVMLTENRRLREPLQGGETGGLSHDSLATPGTRHSLTFEHTRRFARNVFDRSCGTHQAACHTRVIHDFAHWQCVRLKLFP
jgi:hypothetical protein